MSKLSAFVLTVLACGTAYGQIEDAQARFERYQLDSSVGMTEYLMVADLYAEPDADSELIFENNTQIRRVRSDGVIRQTWDSDTDIVAGTDSDEIPGNQVPGMVAGKDVGVFRKGRRETFSADGKTYVMHRGELGIDPPRFQRGVPLGLVRVLNDEPHDWPFVNGLHMWFQGGWSGRLLPMISKAKCVAAEERDGLLHAKFVKEFRGADWVNQGAYITFKDDQIVRVEHFVASVKPNGEEYPAESYGTIATEWDTNGEFAVPKKVIAVLNKIPNPETQNVLVIVNFKWHFPGDKEYEKEKMEIMAMKKLLPSSTFGDEQPSMDPPGK